MRTLRTVGHALLPGIIDPPKPRTFSEALGRCEEHLRALGIDVSLPRTEEEWEAAGWRMRELGLTAEEFAEGLQVLGQGLASMAPAKPPDAPDPPKT